MPSRVKKRGLPGRRKGLGGLAERLRRTRPSLAVTRERVLRRVFERPVFFGLLTAGMVVFLVATWPFVKDHLEAIEVLQIVSGKPVPALIGDVVGHGIKTDNLTIYTESG